MGQVGSVFVFSSILIIPSLKPHQPGADSVPPLQRRKNRAHIFLHAAHFVHHRPIRDPVVLPHVLDRGQRLALCLLLIFLGHLLLPRLQFLLHQLFRKTSRRWTKLSGQRMPAPRRLDQHYRLVEMIAHHRAKFKFHAGAPR